MQRQRKGQEPQEKGEQRRNERNLTFSSPISMMLEEFCRRLRPHIGKKPEEFHRAKKAIAKELGLERIPKNSELQPYCGELKTKPVRTLSGVSPIAVMIRPLSCPFNCVYCPSGKAAKSYTGFEPAARRAIRNKFDPFLQAKNRLKQYKLLGHPADKCQVIVMGGTFLSTPEEYRTWFIKRIYDALNGMESKTLEEAIRFNETAKHRAIGLTIETRPDFSKEEHINEMLRLSATLVELGVQTTDEKLLIKSKRGHPISETIEATRLLKDSAYKITYHMMLGLTGLDRKNLKKELIDFRKIFEDEAFRPDMLKIYPTIVTKGTELYDLWRNGEYEPLTNEEAMELLTEIKQIVPPWVRIMRVQRDVPSNLIEAGPNLTNMRQLVLEKMEKEGKKCRCIRCREVGRRGAERPEMVERKYKASKGVEHFISFEDSEKDSIIGFIRLRFPYKPFRSELENSSLVRELHVYGAQTIIGKSGSWQHRGFGRKLLSRAEELSREKGYSKIAIISGVGVREYYRRLGYRLEGPYMVKKL